MDREAVLGRPVDEFLAAAVFARVFFSAFEFVVEPALGFASLDFAVLVLAMAAPPVATERVDHELKQYENYTPLSI